MGRAPCCDKANVKKGPWSPEEDAKLKDYIDNFGTGGNWIALPQKAGLRRCGKSCRLRWLNYLRPNIKHGEFSEEEDRIICSLYNSIGSRWSIIAAQLPGRTDNDIKNYWNTKLKKKLMSFANKAQLSHQKIKGSNTSANYFPLLLQNSPASQSQLLLSQYRSGGNYHNAPSSTLSFNGFDHSTLNGLASNILQSEGYLSPPPIQSNYLVFGGAPEPSCSSSDGSCTNNNHQKYSYLCNGSSMEEDQDQKLGFSSLLQSVKTQENDSLIWEETAPFMDCGLEEIKQLISSSTISAPNNTGESNNSNGFYFDENKTEERAMLYY